MLKSLYVCATTAALALGASNGHAMSINIGAGLKPALDATDVIQKTAVYIVEGRRYCFYFDGWHGAGWYRCGFAHRRNLGWGGEYGWQGWSYGPAAKRYGHGPFSRVLPDDVLVQLGHDLTRREVVERQLFFLGGGG